MPDLPAFCDTCGTAFRSGFFFENATNVNLSGNKVGPCPRCGGMGHVSDGVFNFAGSTIEILSAPERTVQELTRLVEILSAARAAGAQTDAVANQIKTELPGLAALAKLVPSNRAELYGFLAVVLAAAQLYLTVSPPTAQPSIQVNVTQVLERTLAEGAQAEKARASKPMKKPGRNDPCPCGSGQKYKKCCGLVQ